MSTSANTKGNKFHDKLGHFTSAQLSATSFRAVPGVKIKKVSSTPHYKGQQVQHKTRISKYDTGKLGEHIAVAFMNKIGHQVTRMNVQHGNFPLDMITGKHAMEVKAGLVSNGLSAHKWNLKEGEPSERDKAWLKTASKAQVAKYHAVKKEEIIPRKMTAIKNVNKELGRNIKPYTVASIIHPDTQTADVYMFKGYHHEIRWRHSDTAKAYQGTYRYSKR